ncbi:DUF2256 domain-containing protein [Pseudomonas mohnii]|nr:DUF2256 domain-containing protein [Pseudomonas mohnii]PTT95542.1 hypothetical protein DBR45_48605 [Pseudomonas sp. HMWF031]
MKKSELPVKACAVCGLPFAWRKKWARCWAEVRYCSERCQRRRSSGCHVIPSPTAGRTRNPSRKPARACRRYLVDSNVD